MKFTFYKNHRGQLIPFPSGEANPFKGGLVDPCEFLCKIFLLVFEENIETILQNLDY